MGGPDGTEVKGEQVKGLVPGNGLPLALVRFPEWLREAVRSPQQFRKCAPLRTKVPFADGVRLIAFNGDNSAVFEGSG